jgi:hypothetical protein
MAQSLYRHRSTSTIYNAGRRPAASPQCGVCGGQRPAAPLQSIGNEMST